MTALTHSAAWRALQHHADRLRAQRIDGLFHDDASRVDQFHCVAAGLKLDYSKQLLDAAALQALLVLAEQQDLAGNIRRMYGGDTLNETEGRAVLHVALRAPAGTAIPVAGRDVIPEVHAVLARIDALAEAVRSGAMRGATGQAFRAIVNIGIGGSDLGPRMVCETLQPFVDGPRPVFVSNVDGAQIHEALAALDPATTLICVTSKMFTTQETLANARVARDWLVAALGESAVAQHFVAVSTNQAEVERFGISAERMYGFWDWVGGRYSLWSAVGLPIAVACGPAAFRALREGAAAMDAHFRDTPFERNLPVLLGLIGVWNSTFMGYATQAIVPYAQRLSRFVAWLQQLDMESNGKRVDRAGQVIDYSTTPALWGDVGTNAQHAFFQMLHQSPQVHPVDFILPIAADHPHNALQRILTANCLAQSSALMLGKDEASVCAELQARGMSAEAAAAAAPHRVFPGNRPSNTLLLPRLDAYHLGALLAAYEHRTFVASVLWNINAFDQWGVELGKQIATKVLAALEGGCDAGFDASTRALIAQLRG